MLMISAFSVTMEVDQCYQGCHEEHKSIKGELRKRMDNRMQPNNWEALFWYLSRDMLILFSMLIWTQETPLFYLEGTKHMK